MRSTIVAITVISFSWLSSPPQTPRVPAALLDSANRSPVAVLMQLADAAVPAGLEIRASDPWQPRRKPDFALPREPMVPATALVDAFNAAHADYRAAVRDGVIVIRPIGRHAAYLDAPSTVGHVTVLGVMKAGRDIFAGLDPAVNSPGGILGSIMATPEEAGETTQISLDGHGRANMDLLNDLVRQRPSGWYVVSSDDAGPARVLKFGFMSVRGVSAEIDLSSRGRK